MTETTTAKHDPTPWTYHIGEDYTEFYDANDVSIMLVRGQMDEDQAALIAAAPDLLAACWEALDRFFDGEDPAFGCATQAQAAECRARATGRVEAVLRAAIAKAEGGAS